MEKLSKATEGLRALLRAEELGKGREKSLAAAGIVEGLNSVVVKAAEDYGRAFSVGVEALFLLCDEGDVNLRNVAEESLAAVFRKLVTEGNATRVHVELYRELKRNGAARSLRVALFLFADLAHLIRPTKARMFMVSLVGPLRELFGRGEKGLADALTTTAERILPVLAPFLNDEEMKQLVEALVERLGAPEFHERLMAATVLFSVAAHARKSRLATLFVFRKLLDLVVPVNPHQSAVQIQGVLMCLRLIFPLIQFSDMSEFEARSDLAASKGAAQRLEISLHVSVDHLLQLVEVCASYALGPNSTVVTAALELLGAVLAAPPSALRVVLVEPAGPGPSRLADVARPTSGAEQGPPSAFLSLRRPRKHSTTGGQHSGLSSKVGSEQDLSSVVLDIPSIALEDPRPLFPELSSPEPPISDAGVGRVIDTGFPETSASETCDSSDEATDSELGPRLPLPLNLSAASDLDEERMDETPLMSPTGLPPMVQGVWEAEAPLAEHSARLLSDRFLVAADGGTLPDAADKDDPGLPWARKAHKRLVLGVLGSLVGLEAGLLGGLEPVLAFADHEDQGLRAAVAVLAAVAVAGDDVAPPLAERLRAILQKSLRDKDVVKDCIEGLAKAGTITQLLKRDTASQSFALELIRLVMQSLPKSNYVRKIKTAELIAELPFKRIRDVEKELYGTSGLEESLWRAFKTEILFDGDPKARDAAATLLPRLLRRLRIESQPAADGLWRSGGEGRPALLDDFPPVHSLAWPYSATSPREAPPAALPSVLRELMRDVSSGGEAAAGAVEALTVLAAEWPPTLARAAWGLEFGTGVEGGIGFLAHVFQLLPATTGPKNYASLLRLTGVLFAGQAQRELEIPRQQRSEKWPLLFHMATAAFASDLLLHCVRLLHLYWLVVNEMAPSAPSTSVLPPAPSLSPLKTFAKATIGPQKAPAAVPPPPSSAKVKAGDVSGVPHLLKLHATLRNSHGVWKTSLSPRVSEHFAELLVAALNCLGQVLEVATLSEVSGLAEELLTYLRSTMTAVPWESVAVVTQLLKALFGTNLSLAVSAAPAAASFTPTTKAAPAYRELSSFGEAMGAGAGRLEAAGGRMGRHLGWLASRGDRHVVGLLRNAQSKAALTNYIRFFEPVVVQSLKLYTSSVGAGLQRAVLGLVSGLVSVRVNYCLLDTDFKFRDFLFQQLEAVTQDNFRDASSLVPALMSFLVVLSYEKKAETPIVDVSKIRGFAESLVASGQNASDIVLPVFHTLVCDLFSVRPQQKPETVDLEAHQEMLVSFVGKLVGEPAALDLLALLLAALKAADEAKWRRYSRSLADRLLPLLKESQVGWAHWPEVCAGLRLVESLWESAFRPADELLQALLAPAQEAQGEALERWAGARVVSLWALLLHSKEDAFLPRLQQIPGAHNRGLGAFLIELTQTLARDAASSLLISACLDWCLHLLLQILRTDVWPETRKELASTLADWDRTGDAFLGVEDGTLTSLWLQILAEAGVSRVPPILANVFSPANGAKRDAEMTALGKSCMRNEHLSRVLVAEYRRKLLESCHLPAVQALLIESLKKSTPEESALTVTTALAALKTANKLCQVRGMMAVLLGTEGRHSGPILKGALCELGQPSSRLLRLPVAAGLLGQVAGRQLAHLRGSTARPLSSAELTDLLQGFSQELRQRFPAVFDELLRLLRSWDAPAAAVFREEDAARRAEIVAPSGAKLNRLKWVQLVQAAAGARGLFSAAALAEAVADCAPDEVAEILSSPTIAGAQLEACLRLALSREGESEGSGAALYRGARLGLMRRVSSVGRGSVLPPPDWALLLPLSTAFEADEVAAAAVPDADLFGVAKFLGLLYQTDPAALNLGALVEVLGGLTRILITGRFLDWLRGTTLLPSVPFQLATIAFLFRALRGRSWGLEERLQALSTLPFGIPDGGDESAGAYPQAWRQMSALLAWVHDPEPARQLADLRAAGWHAQALGVLRKAVLATSRLDAVASLCRVPLSAFHCGWAPAARWEEKANGEVVLVLPTTPVHLLQNPDVLRAAVAHIAATGWVERSKFEEMQCALQGVFSATPVGAGELAKMPASEVSERVEASALAVGCMTGLLLQSLLSPASGNPLSGHYLLKHRERQPAFISSKNGMKMLVLKSRIRAAQSRLGFHLGHTERRIAAAVQGPHQRWLQVCGGNPERVADGGRLGFGQLSTEALWSLTGVLAAEKRLLSEPPPPPAPDLTPAKAAQNFVRDQVMGMLGTSPSASDPLNATGSPAKVDIDASFASQEDLTAPLPSPVYEEEEEAPKVGSGLPRSLSSYVLGANSSLDLVSALHFLLDMYTHWLSEGADSVPLGLLAATVRSLVSVSELFTERQQYEWMRSQLRGVWASGRAAEDELLTPHVILGLLKCAAVLGTEDAEGQKEIEALMSLGLSSELLAVRLFTLHGLMYLLQSLGSDESWSLIPPLVDFLGLEMEGSLACADFSAVLSRQQSIDYQLIVWSLAFHITESFQDPYSRQNFVPKFLEQCQRAWRCPTLSLVVVEAVEVGLESLLRGTALDAAQRGAVGRLATSLLQHPPHTPTHTLLALCLSLTAIYTGSDSEELSGREPKLAAMEQLTHLFAKVCGGSAVEAAGVGALLGSYLVEQFQPGDVMNRLMSEILSPSQRHPKVLIRAVRRLFEVLWVREAWDVVADWALASLPSLAHVRAPPASTTVRPATLNLLSAFLVTAANPAAPLANLFPLTLDRIGRSGPVDKDLFMLILPNWRSQLEDAGQRSALESILRKAADAAHPDSDFASAVRALLESEAQSSHLGPLGPPPSP